MPDGSTLFTTQLALPFSLVKGMPDIQAAYAELGGEEFGEAGGDGLAGLLAPNADCHEYGSATGATYNFGPYANTLDRKEVFVRYLLFAYWYERANVRDTGTWDGPVDQVATCAVGGGRAESGYRLWSTGVGVQGQQWRDRNHALAQPSTTYHDMIDQDWDVGDKKSTVAASTDFQVLFGPVGVSGSVSQGASGRNTGNVGSGPPGSSLGGSKDPTADRGRTVWAWWEKLCGPLPCNKYNGSTHYQGAVGIGLYEFPAIANEWFGEWQITAQWVS